MRNSLKQVLCLALALCLLGMAMFVPAKADTGEQGERWNIMLVIDGSASLWSGIKSDPDGMRYEAINSFLDTLHSTGHKVGAIVFNANQTTDSSDSAMESCIYVNTGMLDLDGNEPRDEIKNQVIHARKNEDSTPQTDLGTALLVAERELQKVSGNGNRSAVFLFSDGIMEVNNSIKAKAKSNLELAEEEMRNNGMIFCGVFLNQGGRYHSEIRDIAYAANGISEGMGLGNYYIEITDAKSCAESTDRFMTLLGYSIGDQVAISNNFESSFRVPGIGVEEANIRLRTDNGNPMPAGVEVSFTMPDGTTSPANVVATTCSVGRTYQVYKLEHPDSGTWTVHVKVPDDNKIAIYYSPVFSFYVGASLTTDVQPADMHAGQTVTANCQLMKNGQALTDPAYYREYTCELVLTEVNTGAEQRIEVLANSNGEFKTPIVLEYGVFDAVAVFSCDQLSVTTDHQIWATPNTVPTANDTNVFLKYSFLSEGRETIELDDFIDDIEDGQNLTVSISGGSCDMGGVNLNGHSLELVGRSCGSGTVEITAADSQGAAAQMTVHVETKNQSVAVILMILAVLVAAILAFILIKRSAGNFKLDGRLTLDMVFTDENGEDVNVSGLSLKRPGNDNLGNTCTLYQLLALELKDEFSGLHDELSGEELEQFSKYIESRGRSLLQSIRLSTGRTKDSGKTVAALRVNNGRETELVYNGASRQYSDANQKIKLRYSKGKSSNGPDPDEPIEDTGLLDDDEDERALEDIEEIIPDDDD